MSGKDFDGMGLHFVFGFLFPRGAVPHCVSACVLLSAIPQNVVPPVMCHVRPPLRAVTLAALAVRCGVS